jgi:peptide/nickel transport system permease protein
MTESVIGIEARGKEPKRHSFFVELFIRMFKEKPLGTVGLVIFLILLLTGIFANLIAPYALGKVSLVEKLLPPSLTHILGTDQLGRDELSNIIYGARISLIIGTIATTIMTIVSVLIGATSGYIGGKFDLVVQRFVDAWLSIPGMLVLLTLMSIMGNGTWRLKKICTSMPPAPLDAPPA